MNAVVRTSHRSPPPAMQPAIARLDEHRLRQAIATACARIAPLWPLRHFVAVNPLLGWTGRPFADACAALRRIARTDVLMPRAFYRDAIADGRIHDGDLAAAIAQRPAGADGPRDAARLRAMAFEAAPATPPHAVVETIAEVLDRLADGDRQVSRTAFMVDEISRWCASYFDEGQALWPLPSRALAPYPAWRAGARHDRNPEVMGVRGYRATVAALPDDPVAAIALVLDELGIPARAWTDYLLRALLDIAGWAGIARQRGWEAQLRGGDDDTLVHLLAIRLAWGLALFHERDDARFRDAWHAAMQRASSLPREDALAHDSDLAIDLLLHAAYEHAAQRAWLARFGARPAPAPAAKVAEERPALQAVFCIDVRSEPFRRALEAGDPGIETLGFAGFFGFAIEHVGLGDERGHAHCPALLAPACTVREVPRRVDDTARTRIETRTRRQRRLARAWGAFRQGAVACFAFVETSGWLYAGKLLGLALRPWPLTSRAAGDAPARTAPELRVRDDGARTSGVSLDAQIAAAEGALRGMSLTQRFAPLVLLVGHGSSSTNNPHASALDCGACGGHTGEANARVAAMALNDPTVRAGLRARGIDIPDDTRFVAALHDTTSDDVRCLDTDALSAEATAHLARAREWLQQAGARCRHERAPRLLLDPGQPLDAAVRARGRDASQVRPEWGLAGNAAFIAAPRAVTTGLDLHGRAFLHSYDWRDDRDFAVLGLILGAPMVVASWINLQYFAATANPRAFGSGNKVLHNVVAGLGVLEGNGGDLKAGLPLQSVHDGRASAHEPLRLNVFVAAPRAAIDAAIASQPAVHDLVAHQWLHLFALDDDGRPTHRRRPEGGWEALA